MKVVILGAGTAIPAKNYSPAGVSIKIGKEHVLLDCGPGTLQRLHAVGVSIFDIDRVFLSHFHLDHCLDAAFLIFARRIPTPIRQKPLTIYGPKGLKRLFHRLNQAFGGWISPSGFRLTLHELGETRLRLPGYTVETRRMNHYETGAIGYRLTRAGRSVAYSGDTDVCQAIVELGHDADLLVLECSTTDERKAGGHLTPSECGHIAAAASAKHLVLTHFYPVFHGYDIRRRVRRSFRGRLTLARDFSTFQR